jgi:hypothetical protein
MSEDMHPIRSTAWATAVAALLGACHPAEQPSPPTESAQIETDAGAPVLAAVQNARAAIAAGDQVAAFNDVNLGIGYAAGLPGAGSALYPPEAAPPGYHSASDGGGGGGGGGGQGGHGGSHRHGGGAQGADGRQPAAAALPPIAAAPPAEAATGPARRAGHAGRNGHPGRPATNEPASFSAFDAQVRLQSAQAKLQARDAAGADADLATLEAAARPPAPPSLPLIRADQSLTLAAADVAGGRLPQLRTQLATAKASLDAYQANQHAAEARALASAIGQVLDQAGGLRALPPAQLASWRGRVDGWL